MLFKEPAFAVADAPSPQKLEPDAQDADVDSEAAAGQAHSKVCWKP